MIPPSPLDAPGAFRRLAARRRLRQRRQRAVASVALLGLAGSCSVAPAPHLARLAPPIRQASASIAAAATNLPEQPSSAMPTDDEIAAVARDFGDDAATEAAPPQGKPFDPRNPGITLSSGPAAEPFRFTGGPLAAVRAENCLATAIYYEAASESESGQRAVAQVILNRVRHPAYPSSVCGVVYQGSEQQGHCQFTFSCDGALARSSPSRKGWGVASRIAREALNGAVYAPIGLATHYHTLAVAPNWSRSLAVSAVVGAHIFFRWIGAAGQPAAFRQAYAAIEPMPGPHARSATQLASAVMQPALAYALTTVAPAPAASAAPAPAPSAGLTPDDQIRPEFRDSGKWIGPQSGRTLR